MTTAVRTRRRAVDVDENGRLTEELRAAATKLAKANIVKNAAASVERKAQKDMDVLMAKASDGKPWEFVHEFMTAEGVTRTLDATYAEGKTETMDVRKLHKMVDLETFLDCVTAAKGTVNEKAGSNIEATCTIEKKTDYKAKVSVRK